MWDWILIGSLGALMTAGFGFFNCFLLFTLFVHKIQLLNIFTLSPQQMKLRVE